MTNSAHRRAASTEQGRALIGETEASSPETFSRVSLTGGMDINRQAPLRTLMLGGRSLTSRGRRPDGAAPWRSWNRTNHAQRRIGRRPVLESE
jgi:hypothetical protein